MERASVAKSTCCWWATQAQVIAKRLAGNSAAGEQLSIALLVCKGAIVAYWLEKQALS